MFISLDVIGPTAAGGSVDSDHIQHVTLAANLPARKTCNHVTPMEDKMLLL